MKKMHKPKYKILLSYRIWSWLLLWDYKCCDMENPVFLQPEEIQWVNNIQKLIDQKNIQKLDKPFIRNKVLALTSEPARTPHVSKFFFVLAIANLKKSSIILTGCNANTNKLASHPLK